MFLLLFFIWRIHYEHLNDRFHCNLLLNKLRRANGMLSKARHMISLIHLKMLYFAIFSSHLTYGCQIWAQKSNIFNRKVFTAQNKAVRIMTFLMFGQVANQYMGNLKSSNSKTKYFYKIVYLFMTH